MDHKKLNVNDMTLKKRPGFCGALCSFLEGTQYLLRTNMKTQEVSWDKIVI